jgi:predicted amidohydrolase YtcJ
VTGLLITGAEVDGTAVDVAVSGDRIAAVRAVGEQIERPPGAEVIDAGGGALLPGLHDHHVHLQALAARQQSVDVSPGATPDRAHFAAAMSAAAARTPPGDWVRAVGYHERVAGDLDRWHLDDIVRDRPVRVQHRSGALWVLNSAALGAAGVFDGDPPDGCDTDEQGVPNGRLFRLDEWLGRRTPNVDLDLAAVGRLMAGYGFTGVTDATPYPDPDAVAPLAEAVASGDLPLTVTVTGAPCLDPTRIPGPLRPGPAKLLLADHAPPVPDEVGDWIAAARRFGRPVAVHCVTRVALVVTLAALAEMGSFPGDRIEHGAVIGPDLVAPLRQFGLTVVTQPNFVTERGDDYLLDVPPDEQPDLWPLARLLTAGIPVAAGTDAPYGRADPWALLHAAVTRRTAGGRPLGSGERVHPEAALNLLLGPADRPGGLRRRVEAGAPADLCLLHQPLQVALDHLPDNPVRATVRAGTLTWRDPQWPA